MTRSYPQMSSLLAAYFHQDFDVEFEDIYSAADLIIRENIESPALRMLADEMQQAIELGEVIDDGFFANVGVDTSPGTRPPENKAFFRYFINLYHEIAQRPR